MINRTSEISFQNPRGYEISIRLLQEFERGLNPLKPQASLIPCHVLGYGEVSTVFEIQQEGLRELAFKRLCFFETLDELKPYLDTYRLYNQVLENQVGLRLLPYGYALLVNETGRPIFYIIQKRLPPESVGNKVLGQLSPQEIIRLFRLILLELHKVWTFNRNNPQCQVGVDGQVSNWAIEDFDPQHPGLSQGATLLYFDTSTPFIRLQGVEQLNAKLLLRSAPPYLVWILRILFMQDVLTRYYDSRKVTIDLIANFYKEQRPELIPDLVAEANAYISGDGADLNLVEITRKEVNDYYREDKIIWRLYLGMRRFDRFVQKKMLHRDYPYILPGKIKR